MPRTAWVESPLQLINAIEYAHATGEPLDIMVREGVPQIAHTMNTCEPALPGGVTTRLTSARLVAPRLIAARKLLIGDAFSGYVRGALALGGARDVVLVDDGAASLHLANALAAGRPLTRTRRTEPGWLRWLGRRAGDGLRRLAASASLHVFTVYVDAFSAAEAPRPRVTRNDYAWVVRTFAGSGEVCGAVIVGSALVADGMVSEGAYLSWIRANVPEGGVNYLPHRRERAISLGVIAGIPGVTVVQTHLPVEVALAAPRGITEIRTLPSSVVATLHAIVDQGVPIAVDPVPDGWFTSKATDDLKRLLARIVARERAMHR